MKRAVVQLFWGRRHLEEAVKSRHHPQLDDLPRIAISDSQTLALIKDQSQFTEIVCANFVNPSLLIKASLYSYLPSSYDSFLFLDTDTTVLDDISYGFRRAEEHGIAATMAPHYSLNNFYGFGDVMNQVGIDVVDQLQYNTGVLFFRRRPDVNAVMAKWAELASQYVGTDHNDQPFFTLALEMLGFNPFTLSPSYNYRALGELASGAIRIWHSRAPVPSDVNTYVGTWPARRFVGSRRVR